MKSRSGLSSSTITPDLYFCWRFKYDIAHCWSHLCSSSLCVVFAMDLRLSVVWKKHKFSKNVIGIGQKLHRRVTILFEDFYQTVFYSAKTPAKSPAFKLYFLPSVMAFVVDCLGGLHHHKTETDLSIRLSACQKICMHSGISLWCEDVFPHCVLTSPVMFSYVKHKTQPTICSTIFMHKILLKLKL